LRRITNPHLRVEGTGPGTRDGRRRYDNFVDGLRVGQNQPAAAWVGSFCQKELRSQFGLFGQNSSRGRFGVRSTKIEARRPCRRFGRFTNSHRSNGAVCCLHPQGFGGLAVRRDVLRARPYLTGLTPYGLSKNGFGNAGTARAKTVPAVPACLGGGTGGTANPLYPYDQGGSRCQSGGNPVFGTRLMSSECIDRPMAAPCATTEPSSPRAIQNPS